MKVAPGCSRISACNRLRAARSLGLPLHQCLAASHTTGSSHCPRRRFLHLLIREVPRDSEPGICRPPSRPFESLGAIAQLWRRAQHAQRRSAGEYIQSTNRVRNICICCLSAPSCTGAHRGHSLPSSLHSTFRGHGDGGGLRVAARARAGSTWVPKRYSTRIRDL